MTGDKLELAIKYIRYFCLIINFGFHRDDRCFAVELINFDGCHLSESSSTSPCKFKWMNIC